MAAPGLVLLLRIVRAAVLLAASLTTVAQASAAKASGSGMPEPFRRVAADGDGILEGAPVADLPVERPSAPALQLGLGTAKAPGSATVRSILARADAVAR